MKASINIQRFFRNRIANISPPAGTSICELMYKVNIAKPKRTFAKQGELFNV